MHAPAPISIAVPALETERLRFRALSMADYDEEVAFYATDRSKGVGGPKPAEDVWRTLAFMIGHWVLRGYGLWAIEDKETGRYCGRVGHLNPAGWPELEIGWVLMAHAEGRGLACEAAVAVRRYTYDVMGCTTAISLILADNVRSMALAERLGCTRDGDFQHAQHGAVPIWRHPGPEALA